MQLTLSIPQLTPERLLRWGVLAALLTPLVVWLPALVYPFITTKVFYFRMLVEALVPLGVFVALRRSGFTRPPANASSVGEWRAGMVTRKDAESPHPNPLPASSAAAQPFGSVAPADAAGRPRGEGDPTHYALRTTHSLGPIGFALLIWAATLMITTATGVDWSRSFLSTTERMMGVFTFFHFVLYFFLLRMVVRHAGSASGISNFKFQISNFEMWRPVFWTVALVGACAAVIPFLVEHLPKYKPFLFTSSTLGNSIYLGNFLLFVLFFALVLLVREKKIILKFVAAAIGILAVAGVLHASSRGAFLGAVAGVGTLLLVLAIKGSERNLQIFKFTKLRIPIIGNFANLQIGKFDPVRWGAIGLLSLLIAGGLSVIAWNDHPLVRRIPTIREFQLATMFQSTATTRIMAWEIAWRAFKERPFFGWGPENYHYAFSAFYNPKFLRFGVQETWFDRSHSAYMDALSMNGIVGTLAYVGIFAVAILLLIRTLRAQRITNDQLPMTNIQSPISNLSIPYLEPAIALSLLVAYMVQNIFVFDHASSWLMLIVLLVWIESMTRTNADRTRTVADIPLAPPSFRGGERVGVRGIVACTAIASFMLLVWGNLLPLRANMAVRDALPAMRKGGFDAGKDAYARALRISSPHHTETIELFGKELIERSNGGLALEALQNPEFPSLVKWAVEEMERQHARHPRDARLAIMIGQLWNTLLPQEKSIIIHSDKAFARAREISPRRQEIYASWARAKFMAQDFEEAESLLRTAIALDPEVADPHWLLGVIFFTARNYEAAWKEIRIAVLMGYSFPDATQVIFAGQIAERTGHTPEALSLYEKWMGAFKDAMLYARAAASASWGGEAYKEKAREYAKKAVELDPNLREQLKPLLE